MSEPYETSTTIEPPNLAVPPGPWDADAWIIERPDRFHTSGDQTCAVATCDRPAGRAQGVKAHIADVLCISHRRRFKKCKEPSISTFIETQRTARPILNPRGKTNRKPFSPITFNRIRPGAAHELRYIVGMKIKIRSWSDSRYIHQCVSAAVELCALFDIDSLRAHSLDSLISLAAGDRFQTHCHERGMQSARRVLLDALPSAMKLLNNATPDPWAADVWRPRELGVKSERAGGERTLYWTGVTVAWLRAGMMSYCKRAHQTGTRSWSTFATYVRGATLLSKYVDEEIGQLAPADLTRAAFLEFLGWARAGEQGPTNLGAINCLARVLVHLRDDDDVPDLPNTTYLLRGENAVSKTRAPKPFPDDLLSQIDDMIAHDTEMDDDIRLMLRVFRATGPRASEALLLKRDNIRYTDGRGYSLEYFMTKTDNWRRIPIPERLGKDLVTQSEFVAHTHGEQCQWLFPYDGRSPRACVLVGDSMNVPWTYSTFVTAVWQAYTRNGITRSAMSGELLTGPGLHRYRHTIATGLLNEGWTQYEVQEFLGHSSPVMMQSYAKIHEDTLREKYEEFVKQSIDIDGEKTADQVSAAANVERLRDRMIRSTLPNGYCTLPEKQKCDFVPTPCLSCKPFFRTTPTFLPVHIRQRDETLRLIEVAKAEGRARAADALQNTLDRLDTIIDSLTAETPDHASA
jgi:integrase/recombinase XerD